MNKADRKARLKVWRDHERQEAQAHLPLEDTEMEALFSMLDRRLPETGCDHTRRLTDAWLQERGHSVDPVHEWLDDNGGFCDCEVLANSEGAWREATGRG